MQTIYGVLADNGDGSASMLWFRDLPDIDSMEERHPERWGISEGISQTLTFPDDLDLEKCGFRFTTMVDVFEDDDLEE